MAPTFTLTAHNLRWLPGSNLSSDIDAGFQALAEDVDLALGRVSGSLQEGVMEASSLMVTQRGSGANMSVDVASNTSVFNGIGAYVASDTAPQALYPIPVTGAVTNVAIGSNASGNPRVDRVVVNSVGTISVLAGSAASGATLNNLTGAASVPNDSLLLADVLVANGAASITNSVIRDRRKWARGYYRSALYTVGFVNRTSGTLSAIDSAIDQRVECSGAPVVVTLDAGWFSLAANQAISVDLMIDGVAQGLVRIDNACEASGDTQVFHAQWRVAPAAGSHIFTPAFASSNATTQVAIGGDATHPLLFAVEEMLRQNTANNTVTSG